LHSSAVQTYNQPMSRISNLYRLQDIDLKIKSCRTRLQEIESLLSNNETLNRLRSIAGESEEILDHAQKNMHRVEQDVTMLRQKIAAAEHKLYSGTVKNPKELEDIQHETIALKRHLSTLEDNQLEAMIEMEEAEKQHIHDSEEVEKEEIRLAASGSTLLKEKQQLENGLEKLAAERSAALVVADPVDVENYESLQGRLGSNVISRIKDGSCGICGMVVAGSTLQSVRTGSEILRCSQCSRILYAG
jgi:uncharacterized protein